MLASILTLILTVFAVVRPIASNSSNDAVAVTGSSAGLFVHGGLLNDLPRNNAVSVACSSTGLLISGGLRDNVVGLGEERDDGERIHL